MDRIGKSLMTVHFKTRGSRKSVYLEEEKDYMIPLPERDFELSEWKTATVQLNYHIAVDKMNYSVPYEYVGKRVELGPRNLILTFIINAHWSVPIKGCMEERISIPQTLIICRKIINYLPGMETVSKDGQLQ